MRLRVFSAMKNIMGDYENDEEMQLLVRVFSLIALTCHFSESLIQGIQCMTALPLIYRNKVDDSRVNIPVQACTQSGNEALKTAAQRVRHLSFFIMHNMTVPIAPRQMVDFGDYISDT